MMKYFSGPVWLHCLVSYPVDASRYLGMWLDFTTTHRQTWLFSSTSTYHSTDLLTARGVAHLVVHGTIGSTSYETIPPVRLETSGGVLSTVDMVVQRRDGYANLIMMMMSSSHVSESEALDFVARGGAIESWLETCILRWRRKEWNAFRHFTGGDTGLYDTISTAVQLYRKKLSHTHTHARTHARTHTYTHV